MPSNSPEYAHAHYEANKEAYLARARASNVNRQKRYREIIREAKSKPCTDCKIPYPYYVMQFDHVGVEKNFTIGVKATKWAVSEETLLAEIALCEVVCANCHAERTHHRRALGEN